MSKIVAHVTIKVWCKRGSFPLKKQGTLFTVGFYYRWILYLEGFFFEYRFFLSFEWGQEGEHIFFAVQPCRHESRIENAKLGMFLKIRRIGLPKKTHTIMDPIRQHRTDHRFFVM